MVAQNTSSAWGLLRRAPKYTPYPSVCQTRSVEDPPSTPIVSTTRAPRSHIQHNLTHELSKLLDPTYNVESTLDHVYCSFFRGEYWEEIFLHACIIFNRSGIEQEPPSHLFIMMMISLMITSKLLLDDHYTNKTWANYLHMDIREINRLELRFLQRSKFDLMVTTSQFDAFKRHVERRSSEHTTRSLREMPSLT